MAKPRIFVSSTFFDLRSIRANLERFIKEIGYEAILFERGHVPYGKDNSLEEYCYREINNCDMLIAIIGGKYGSQSKSNENSITQNEIKEAIKKGKQIYIFIEKSVHSEYYTYIPNRDVKGFKPVSVDNVKIFEFIESIYSLQVGNPVESFETSEDILRFLKEQWAGLFQRLLMSTSRLSEVEMITDLKNTTETLNNLVSLLTKQKNDDAVIKEVLMFTHPAFNDIKKVADIRYRVCFFDFNELSELLSARGFEYDEATSPNEHYDFDHQKFKKCIRVKRNIFDDELKLKIIPLSKWSKQAITIFDLPDPFDDDIPF
ncbi:DUF4062 domain-containing protein [Yersinia alsatica]|uniref:DUF4062 domain-containing protein n=1 Tax=Yersinia alsatica TaxID=2890317 RepID=UPI00119D2306|nr:DUF4062 domain-containing protein [Yersinia alsatica]